MKKILIDILDFAIGAIVFFSSLYGTTLFINQLLGFDNNIQALSLIIAFLMIGRFLFKISERENKE